MAELPKRPSTARASLGASGERLEASWLEARGYRILARNWHCRGGELDLIAEQAGMLVFVEVKTRRGVALGAPEEAITPAKRGRLLHAAQTYLAEQQREDVPYRIDVIAVQLAPTGKLLDVRHYPYAIPDEE